MHTIVKVYAVFLGKCQVVYKQLKTIIYPINNQSER